jgi:hypothetical protein
MATVPKLENFFPELFSGTDRRSEPRMAVNMAARMKSLSPLMSTGPSIRARIVEVSHSGMTLRMNREFQLGELVQVIVPEMFYLGVVRHCRRIDTEFEAGIKLSERIPSSLV